ncbi:MAG: hypothetical protein ACODAU_01600 [Myxococcota bacterium]
MTRSERRYRWLARTWGHVFLGAGALFAVAPDAVARGLAWEGALLGLDGSIRFGGGTLAWALSLSLMATLVLLAYRSAARPRDPGPYRALMLSKLTSTAVFVLLAIEQGPVWLLAANADFFVALTLFVVRLPVPDEGPATGFAARYLSWMGVDADGRTHFAEMLARNPTSVRLGVRAANGFFTYAAPLLLTGRPHTAASLDDASMTALVDRIRTSRHPLVRMLWILIHQPACGALARARCHAAATTRAPRPAPGTVENAA